MATENSWAKVALYFSQLEAQKSKAALFTRKSLIDNHLRAMVYLVRSVGATPDQTLSRTLQSLRDAGLIVFHSRGIYRLVKNNSETTNLLLAQEKVSRETKADRAARADKTSKKESRGEAIVRKLLDSMNIKYEKEKTFKEMRLKGQLRFDFYFESDAKKYAIEYDGIQHSIAVQFFGGVPKMIEGNIRDKIKNKYAQENDIKLLRVKGLDSEEIKEKIKKLVS